VRRIRKLPLKENRAFSLIHAFLKGDRKEISKAQSQFRNIQIPLEKETQNWLDGVVSQGCNRDLILAAALILSKRVKFWSSYIPYLPKHGTELRNAAEVLMSMSSDPLFQFGRATYLAKLAKILKSLADRSDEKSKNIHLAFTRHHTIRMRTLLLMFNHLKEKTGANQWNKSAGLILHFAESGVNIDAKQLQMAYREYSKKASRIRLITPSIK
jgi:hypothetical protein